jgi:flagellar motor protein MotB
MVTEETDLSTERAVNILNFFINRENVEPQRIAIAGYNTSEIDNEDIIRIIVLKK